MTEDQKAPPPEDDAPIRAWISYGLERGFQADQLNGLNRDQVRALVKGEPMPGAAEKPEAPADAPVPARKRASSRTRKTTTPPPDPEPESSSSPFLPDQQRRLEAVTVARGIIGIEHRPGGLAGGRIPANVIAICDLAEFILTGLHPLTGYTATVKQQVSEAIASAANPDADDDGPGLVVVNPTTTQEGTA